jgi:hypothetical protein
MACGKGVGDNAHTIPTALRVTLHVLCSGSISLMITAETEERRHGKESFQNAAVSVPDGRIILILRRCVISASGWFVDRGRRGKVAQWQSSCVRGAKHDNLGVFESHPPAL